MTHRYYDPGTGKFLNRDPIGYAGGENLYGFADGNPVNESDPNGTSTSPFVPADNRSTSQKIRDFFFWKEVTAGLLWDRFVTRGANAVGAGVAISGMMQSGVTGEGRQIPHGFENEQAFDDFSNTLTDGLREAGYGGTEPVFQGSSVTGYKFMKPGQYGPPAPFDVGRTSDYDIALSNPSLFQKAEEAGVPIWGRNNVPRSRPLTGEDLQKLGLSELAQNLSRKSGRPVKFMLYRNLSDVSARGGGIKVWPGHS